MHIIDITCDLNPQTRTYEGDPEVRVQPCASVDTDGYALCRLQMGTHSGTHVDAPRHVNRAGSTVAQIPLDVLVGECWVSEGMEVPLGAKRVLLKGHTEDDAALNLSQARALLNAGVQLLGTDGLSIGDSETHRALLGSGCIILEALDLSGAEPGPHFLCALPLKMETDGAPVRACLIDDLAAGA